MENQQENYRHIRVLTVGWAFYFGYTSLTNGSFAKRYSQNTYMSIRLFPIIIQQMN
ncbi:hypothetical protein I8F94_05930 [Enterococcus gallinarum]|nr:hypothetical protein [Enterococcus gallinarum]